MHQFGCTNHSSTINLPNCLMTQAYSKQRNSSSESLDHSQRNTSVVWGSRSRRNDDSFRTQLFNLVQSNSIIASNFYHFAQFAKVLNQVVSERVVVVDD